MWPQPDKSKTSMKPRKDGPTQVQTATVTAVAFQSPTRPGTRRTKNPQVSVPHHCQPRLPDDLPRASQRTTGSGERRAHRRRLKHRRGFARASCRGDFFDVSLGGQRLTQEREGREVCVVRVRCWLMTEEGVILSTCCAVL